MLMHHFGERSFGPEQCGNTCDVCQALAAGGKQVGVWGLWMLWRPARCNALGLHNWASAPRHRTGASWLVHKKSNRPSDRRRQEHRPRQARRPPSPNPRCNRANHRANRPSRPM
jgi:hypothetical protein